jgi:hypothetical protein
MAAIAACLQAADRASGPAELANAESQLLAGWNPTQH